MNTLNKLWTIRCRFVVWTTEVDHTPCILLARKVQQPGLTRVHCPVESNKAGAFIWHVKGGKVVEDRHKARAQDQEDQASTLQVTKSVMEVR